MSAAPHFRAIHAMLAAVGSLVEREAQRNWDGLQISADDRSLLASAAIADFWCMLAAAGLNPTEERVARYRELMEQGLMDPEDAP